MFPEEAEERNESEAAAWRNQKCTWLKDIEHYETCIFLVHPHGAPTCLFLKASTRSAA